MDVESAHEADLQDDASRFCGVDHGLAFGRIHGHRLFAEDVFTGAGGGHGDVAVKGGGSGDDDGVHGRVVEQPEVIRVGGGAVEFAAGRLAGCGHGVGDRGDAGAGHEAGEVAGVDQTGTTRSDDANAEGGWSHGGQPSEIGGGTQ